MDRRTSICLPLPLLLPFHPFFFFLFSSSFFFLSFPSPTEAWNKTERPRDERRREGREEWGGGKRKSIEDSRGCDRWSRVETRRLHESVETTLRAANDSITRVATNTAHRFAETSRRVSEGNRNSAFSPSERERIRLGRLRDSIFFLFLLVEEFLFRSPVSLVSLEEQFVHIHPSNLIDCNKFFSEQNGGSRRVVGDGMLRPEYTV